MRYLGIDFGSKRVGIALSDEEGGMAFPKLVLENRKGLLEEVVALAKQEHVEAVVIGESKNYQQEDNKIMTIAREFADALSKEGGLTIHFEPEFMSSTQAEGLQGKNDMLDASAAAIILQSFLDKQKFKQ